MVIISRFETWLALTCSKSLLSRLRTRLTFDLSESWFSKARKWPILFHYRTSAIEKSLPIVINIQINKNETICKINKNTNLKTCIISVDYFERLRQVYHLLFLTLLITNLNFNSSVKYYKRLVSQTTYFSTAKVTSVWVGCYTLIAGIQGNFWFSAMTRGDSIILTFHVLPLARGQKLSDIDNYKSIDSLSPEKFRKIRKIRLLTRRNETDNSSFLIGSLQK